MITTTTTASTTTTTTVAAAEADARQNASHSNVAGRAEIQLPGGRLLQVTYMVRRATFRYCLVIHGTRFDLIREEAVEAFPA